MITFKQAFELAKAANKESVPLKKTADDAGDFWVFERDYNIDAIIIGEQPIAVDKKDGKVWRWFPPSMTKKQWDACLHAKKVKIPAEWFEPVEAVK